MLEALKAKCKAVGTLSYLGKKVTKVTFGGADGAMSGYWLIGDGDAVEKAVLEYKTNTAALNCEGPLGGVTINILLRASNKTQDPRPPPRPPPRGRSPDARPAASFRGSRKTFC